MALPLVWLKRLWQPIVQLFKQGLSPHKIAQCLVLGTLFALFPVLGVTSLLNAAVALALRLNMPAIQAINWLLAGVQVLLIIPLIRVGEWLFNDPRIPLSLDDLTHVFRTDPAGFFTLFGMAFVHAIAAWAVSGVPAAAGAYAVLVAGIHIWQRHRGKACPPA